VPMVGPDLQDLLIECPGEYSAVGAVALRKDCSI